MSIRTQRRHFSPTNSKGNLYYVRLKTDSGMFYKIGFTTLPSVHERLNYSGSSDAQYIDSVLMFTELDDAFGIEQELHECLDGKRAFSKYSAIEQFPLSRNGQTELYVEDVLDLDDDYTPEQSTQAYRLIKAKRLSMAGKTERQDRIQSIIIRLISGLVVIALSPILFAILWCRCLYSGDNIKSETISALDSLTGGKRQAAQEQAERDAKIDRIMSNIRRVETDRMIKIIKELDELGFEW